MGVFVEVAFGFLHEREREEEHVVAVALGPVGDGESDAESGDESAGGDQWESGGGEDHGEDL